MDQLNFTDIYHNLITPIVQVFPQLLAALGVLIVGWIGVRLLVRLLRNLLNRLGVNRLSDYINQMELFGEGSVKLNLTKVVCAFVYYFLMLMVWVLSADVLGIDAITIMLNDIIAYIPNLFVAFIYLLIGILLADIVRKFFLTTLQSFGIPSARLIAGFVFYFLIINIMLGALTQAKINTEFIAANISIILGGIVLAFAIGYGLASKDIARNLISAFYWKQKFNIGDVIEVDGVRGEIMVIDNSHFILSQDDKQIMLPMYKLSRSTTTLISKAPLLSDEDD